MVSKKKPLKSKKSHKLKSSGGKKKKTIYYFYADYCGYCKRFNPLFNKLKRKYKDKIQFVYSKEYIKEPVFNIRF